MPDFILRTLDLKKIFGGITAINNANVEITYKGVTGIIGPNGAGKTTFFNLLSGFLKPTSGKILYEHNDITHLKPHKIARAGLSRSFQIANLFPNMTIEETVLLPLLTSPNVIYKSIKDLRKRTDQLLQSVGLDQRKKTFVRDLTQGELKILDLIRAVSNEPKLLLLDEPFAGLGHQTILQLAQIIEELRKKTTVIIIEHRLRELLNLVDRIIVINFGNIIADDSPEQIIKNQAVIDSYLGKEKVK